MSGGEYDFCFNGYPLLAKAPVDKDLNKFHKGVIETNYLYINRLLKTDNDKDNVAKAKKFIIELAIKYYEEKDENHPNIKLLKNQIKFIDAIGPVAAPVVSATLGVVEPGGQVAAPEPVGTVASGPVVALVAKITPTKQLSINNSNYSFNQKIYYEINGLNQVYNMFASSDNEEYIVIITTNGGNSLKIYKKESKYTKTPPLYRDSNYNLYSMNELYKIAQEENYGSIQNFTTLQENEKYNYYVKIFNDIQESEDQKKFSEDLKNKEDLNIINDIDHNKSYHKTQNNILLVFNNDPIICKIYINDNEFKYYYMFKVINTIITSKEFPIENTILYISYDDNIIIVKKDDSLYIIYKKIEKNNKEKQKYKILYKLNNNNVRTEPSQSIDNLSLRNIYDNTTTDNITTDGAITDDINTIFGGSSDTDNDNDINILLILIMKNIMFATPENLNKLKEKYNK